LDDLFNLGLIFRFADSGWYYRDTVVKRHVLVGGVDSSIFDTAFLVVGHQNFRNTAEKVKSSDMGTNPVG
jgi:hypothetical protein